MVLIFPNSLTSLDKEVVARIDARGGGTNLALLEAVAVEAALGASEGKDSEVEVVGAAVFFGQGMRIPVTPEALGGLGRTTFRTTGGGDLPNPSPKAY